MHRADPLAALLLAALMLPGLALAGAAVDPSALAPFADVEWDDQLGGRDRLAAHQGERVLLIIVEARRLPLAGKWAEAIEARDLGLTLLTVADAPPDVLVEPDRFAQTLRKRVPAGVRILMDPRRQLAAALILDTAEPNLLLVGPDGTLAAAFRGRLTPALLEQVAAAAAGLPGMPAGIVP